MLGQCHWFNCYELDFLCFRILDQIVKLLNVCVEALQRGLCEEILMDQYKYIMANEKKKMCHFGEYHLTQIKDCLKCTLFCIANVIELLGIVWLQHLT